MRVDAVLHVPDSFKQGVLYLEACDYLAVYAVGYGLDNVPFGAEADIAGITGYPGKGGYEARAEIGEFLEYQPYPRVIVCNRELVAPGLQRIIYVSVYDHVFGKVIQDEP